MTQCNIANSSFKRAHAAYAQFRFCFLCARKFSIFFGLCSWQLHSVCLVWCRGRDKATIVNNFIRDLYSPALSLTHTQRVHSVSLARLTLLLLLLLLLGANHKNGQRAPFWVAFKVLFHFIAIYFSWFCFISFLDFLLFSCVLFAKYAHTYTRTLTHTHALWNAICCAFFLVFICRFADCKLSRFAESRVHFGSVCCGQL